MSRMPLRGCGWLGDGRAVYIENKKTASRTETRLDRGWERRDKWRVPSGRRALRADKREERGRRAGGGNLHECLECRFTDAESYQGADSPRGYAFQKRGRMKRDQTPAALPASGAPTHCQRKRWTLSNRHSDLGSFSCSRTLPHSSSC